MSELNPALAFKAATKVITVTAADGRAVLDKDGNAIVSVVAVETVIVRLRAHPAQELRVTAVDEARGRWVCCAWKPNPDTWQHERYQPDELEEVRREPREVS